MKRFLALVLVVVALVATWFFTRRPTPHTTPIVAFWQWWPTASADLAQAITEHRAGPWATILSEKITPIGALVWELGPGQHSKYALTLSAEGDPHLRVLAEMWRAVAPAADATWEFHSARQAAVSADASLTIEGNTIAYADFALAHEIVAARRRANVDVYHPVYAKLSDEVRASTARVFLEHLLGEDDVERFVGEIRPTATRPDPFETPQTFVAALAPLRADKGDHFAIFEGKLSDGSPLHAVVNLAIKRIDHLLMDTHYEIHVPMAQALEPIESELRSRLWRDAVFIGHESGGGEHVIHFHAAADIGAQIRAWIAENPDLGVTLKTMADPGWEILRRW